MASSAAVKEQAKKGDGAKKGQTVQDEKYDWSRATREDPRDPRTCGAPCHGVHSPAPPGRGSPSGSNGHAMWQACQVCRLRLLYVPRYGAHAMTRSPGPLPSDVAHVIQTTPENEIKANPSMLKDKTIGLEGAEKSCLTQLQKIRAKKAEATKGYKPPTEVAQVVDSEVLPHHSSRKTRRGSAEDLEESEAGTAQDSWSAVSSPQK